VVDVVLAVALELGAVVLARKLLNAADAGVTGGVEDVQGSRGQAE